MEQLVRQWNVQQLTFQQNMEPHSQRLEESVARVAKISGVEASVSYLSVTNHTLLGSKGTYSIRISVTVIASFSHLQLVHSPHFLFSFPHNLSSPLVRGLKVFAFTAHTLYDQAVMLAANGNKPILTPKAFRELVPKLGAPPKPIGRRK